MGRQRVAPVRAVLARHPEVSSRVRSVVSHSVKICREAHGVIFVFNPDSAAQAKQLDTFHQAFVAGRSLPDTAQVVFAHFLSGDQVSVFSSHDNLKTIFTAWSDKSSASMLYITPSSAPSIQHCSDAVLLLWLCST